MLICHHGDKFPVDVRIYRNCPFCCEPYEKGKFKQHKCLGQKDEKKRRGT